jgi:hypothetical protein
MKPSDLSTIASKLPLSKSTLARNADTLILKDKTGKPTTLVTFEPSKRIRQSSKPLLNGLETECLAFLRSIPNVGIIHPQAKRYRLGNGIWYKPDFTFMHENDENSVCEWAVEVKGPHAFRGGFENLKVAASLYPEMWWVLMWKAKGDWLQQRVLP